jgi:hypothetical protein
MSNQVQLLCNCGCGEVNKDKGQAEVKNLPGLSSLHFRIGIHRSFKTAMLKELSAKDSLAKMTSRNDDDMAVATIDGWATVLDVLSFYQERIINEGYLGTATERLSVLKLARHISYKLGAGVASGTFLSFSLNEAQGAPVKTVIPIKTKVQSIPEQDQLPQIFETSEEIEARVEWNAIKLLTKKRNIPVFGDKEMYLQGINTGLQPGDGLLMIGSERENDPKNENWDFRRVKELTPNADLDHTRITWDKGLGDNRYGRITEPAKNDFKVFAFRQRAFLFGYNAPDFRVLPGTVKSEFLPEGLLGEYYNGNAFDIKVFSRTDSVINNNWGTTCPGNGIDINNFSVRWSGLILSPITGKITFHTDSDDGVRLWINNQLIIDNWTDHASHRDSADILLKEGKLYSIRLDYYENKGLSKIVLSWSALNLPEEIIPKKYFFNHDNCKDWPDFNIIGISGLPDTIHLDAIYPKITKGNWLVMMTEDYEEVYKVTEAIESSRKDFTLTAKTMSVKLSGENLAEKFDTHVRDVVVFAQAEELEIAEMPVTDSIKNDNEVTLEKLMPDFAEGKAIIISGKRLRLQITESAVNPVFTVRGNDIATRTLVTGDSLIILKKPETLVNGKTKWTLQDKGGFKGTIEVYKNAWIITTSAKDDKMVSELHIIKSLTKGVDPTVINLDELITNYFDLPTIEINANIAEATHGETKEEILGNGNGSMVFQKFNLKQTPLTFISATTASGTETTLEILVNDILWKEVPSFFGVSPKGKVYTTTINDNGIVTVQFGDGITGARLPTGTANIKAKYRIGIGSEGLLNEGQLSMLMTPQLGVNKVSNPLATSDAADPETLETARQNAPLTVLTLDRIVSPKDFEDFTRAFAGIGKARADILWNGEKQVVYITIAAENGGPVDKESVLYKSILPAIKNSGQPNSTIYIENYTALSFTLSAGISVSANYEFEIVKKKVVQSLVETFSFNVRDFGQDITPSEVIAVIQSIEGVNYTDLELLNNTDPFLQPHFRLPAQVARWQGSIMKPAELLIINNHSIIITEIVS